MYEENYYELFKSLLNFSRSRKFAETDEAALDEIPYKCLLIHSLLFWLRE